MAGEKGYIGISLSIDGEGFFLNPTLKTVKIEKVLLNSPSFKAGVELGDLVVEVDGKKILGSKANEMKPHLEKEVGQTVRFVLQKLNGEIKHVTVVAGPKPE